MKIPVMYNEEDSAPAAGFRRTRGENGRARGLNNRTAAEILLKAGAKPGEPGSPGAGARPRA